MSGGDLIAQALERQGVSVLFTLCGGHISPILVSAQLGGIRVVDVRHEATAVFAADALARLTGRPGVAVVTAGPGATNTITAVKNAQLAQSPVVLLGGATATLLKGRGALQDIDQIALFRPHVKEALSVKRLRDLVPALDRAFAVAASGVPGPVFLECPVDILYGEDVVRQWYVTKSGAEARGLKDAATAWYIHRHLERLFGGMDGGLPAAPRPEPPRAPKDADVARAARLVAKAERPVLVIGSQALLSPEEVPLLSEAVNILGLPVYLSGMARGLLGPDHPLHLRHRRKDALREADLVLLAGTPCDFRLDYGRHISSRALLVSANRSREDLGRNRKPTLGVLAAPDLFLRALARAAPARPPAVAAWLETLRTHDEARDAEIRAQADTHSSHGVNPLRLCRAIDKALAPDSVIVADGGDFVATASYILHPRRPLSWLDPGAFGTLGVGAGFALGAKLCRPEADVWILFGDGSAGYSLAEFDTFVRHGINVIAVVGNDAAWTQIAREQVEILKDDVATVLRSTDYDRVAEGFGAKGLRITEAEQAHAVLAAARGESRNGHPVLVNALIGRTDFRKGSVSM